MAISGIPASVKITVVIENVAGRAGLAAEGGLALLIEAAGRTVLFDTGNTPALLRNMDALGLGEALARLDAIVLSHGHDDHTGGLAAVLKRLNRQIPVYVGPGFFVRKVTEVSSVWKYIGIASSRAELERLGARIVEGAPVGEILPGLILTSEIRQREKWEELNSVLRIQPGNAPPEVDPFTDEQILAARTPSGLLVFTGCAHRGLMNGIAAAQAAAPGERVRAIFGGSHLGPAPADRVRRTVAEIVKLRPDLVALGHCTGKEAERLVAEAFGERFAALRGGRTWDL